MARFYIEGDILKIDFQDKPNENIRAKMKSNGIRWRPSEHLWAGKHTADTEKIAREVVNDYNLLYPNGQIQSAQVISEPLTPLDQNIIEIMESNQNPDNLKETIQAIIENDSDAVAELYRSYINKARELRLKKLEQEYIEARNSCKQITKQESELKERRQILDEIVMDYIWSHDIQSIDGNDYKMSINETEKYTFSKQFLNDLQAELNLPKCMRFTVSTDKIEIKLDKEILKNEENLPFGVEVLHIPQLKFSSHHQQEVASQNSTNSGVIDISDNEPQVPKNSQSHNLTHKIKDSILKYFRHGYSIDEIHDLLGKEIEHPDICKFLVIAEFNNSQSIDDISRDLSIDPDEIIEILKSGIQEGQINIVQVVGTDIINKVIRYFKKYEYKNESDFCSETNYYDEVSENLVRLILEYFDPRNK